RIGNQTVNVGEGGRRVRKHEIAEKKSGPGIAGFGERNQKNVVRKNKETAPGPMQTQGTFYSGFDVSQHFRSCLCSLRERVSFIAAVNRCATQKQAHHYQYSSGRGSITNAIPNGDELRCGCRRDAQAEKGQTQARFVKITVGFGNQFSGLVKLTLFQFVLALFQQISGPDFSCPFLHYSAIRIFEQKRLFVLLQNRAIAFSHLRPRLAERARASDWHARLQLPRIRDFGAVERGAHPHIVIVAAGKFFVEHAGFHNGLLARDDGRNRNLAALHQQRAKRCLAARGTALHELALLSRESHPAIGIRKTKRRVGGEQLHLRRQVVGHPGIVAVEEGDKLAASVTDGVVASSRGTLVFLLEVDDAVHIWREHFFQFRGIWRTVVHHDGLKILVGLRKDGIEARRNQGRRFVAGNDDADADRRRGTADLEGWAGFGCLHAFPITRVCFKNGFRGIWLSLPQRLKPRLWGLRTARLKPCPSQNLFLKRTQNLFLKRALRTLSVRSVVTYHALVYEL